MHAAKFATAGDFEGLASSTVTLPRPAPDARRVGTPKPPKPTPSLRRRVLTTAAWLGLIALLSYFFWESFLYTPPEQDSSAALPGVFYPSQGNHHLQVGMPFTQYNSNPPTSGPHWLAGHPYQLPSGAAIATPPQWGIYAEELPNETLVHSMEHGGVVIWYRPRTGCDAACVTDLRTLVRRYLGRNHHLILVPSGGLDHAIAVTAWTRLETFDRFDASAIARFISAHEGRYNPENM